MPRACYDDGEFCAQALAGKALGSRAGVVHAPLPKDDPVRRNPNITRAQELLGGWAPKVPLADGLKATVEYFRGRQG